MRDSQRTKLYAAERAMWFEVDGTMIGDRFYQHPFLDFDTPRELQQFVNTVTRSRFWKSVGGRSMVHAKANNRWSSGARGRVTQLDVPPWGMQKPTVLHELAHSLAYTMVPSKPDHGQEFVLIFRRLIENHMGDDVRRKFDLQLEEHRVKWGIGSIPPGKMTAGNPNST